MAVDFPTTGRKYMTARASTGGIVVCPPRLARDYAGDGEPVLLPADLGGPHREGGDEALGAPR